MPSPSRSSCWCGLRGRASGPAAHTPGAQIVVTDAVVVIIGIEMVFDAIAIGVAADDDVQRRALYLPAILVGNLELNSIAPGPSIQIRRPVALAPVAKVQRLDTARIRSRASVSSL